MSKQKQGYFITFEGCEGCGKSTQSKLLEKTIHESGHSVIHTREPGGTKGAEQIRELLVTGDSDRWDKNTELLLHFAARNDHVNKLVIPALNDGKFVICDRFVDSTKAYQGYGHGVQMQLIDFLATSLMPNLKPDITFVLDIDPEKGIKRANQREDHENRYELMNVDFHKKVRDGFLNIAQSEPDRCFIIDATDTIENISKEIINILDQKIVKLF